MPDGDTEMKFAIGHDGCVSVNDTVVETPEQPDILDELPPVEATPIEAEDEQQRVEALEEIARAVVRGDLVPKATPPPVPAVEDVVGYHQRLSRPGADAILKQINDYAAVLPSDEAAKLDGDHRAFNAAFDRFAAANKPPDPGPPVKTGPSREEVEKVLTLKEVRKEAARSISGGLDHGGSESYGGGHQDTGRDKEIARLKLAIRRNPTDTDLAAQLAKYFLGDD